MEGVYGSGFEVLGEVMMCVCVCVYRDLEFRGGLGY